MSAEDTGAAKRRFEFPSAFAILFALIVVAALATHFVPAGMYDRVESVELGREIAVRGSYHAVEAQPQTLADIVMAPVKGFYDPGTEKTRAVDVVLFVLFLGGFMGIVARTGAIEIGIARVMSALHGRQIWTIPILLGLFAIGGTTIGMSDETLPFCALLAPVMMRAGYDSIVAVGVVLIGTNVGIFGATLNPFSTVIGSNAAGIPFTEGIEVRIILLVVAWLLGSAYLMRHAHRIKLDPSRSLLHSRRAELEAHFLSAEAPTARLTRVQAIVLILFALTFAVMIWGVGSQGWWMGEMTALFLVAAIVIGVVARMRENAFTETFIDGARSLLGVALVIGLARGALVVLEEGRIIDTLLNAGEHLVAGLPSAATLAGVFGIEAIMTVLVPSTSGQAVLTLPVLAPLGDFASVERSLIVTAYQAAHGVIVMFAPTSAISMGSLAMARVPYQVWLRFLWPLTLMLSAAALTILSVAALI